jgi:hypothetical protein
MLGPVEHADVRERLSDAPRCRGAQYPAIRLFSVKHRPSSTLESDTEVVGGMHPETIPATAAGYFYRELHSGRAIV